MSLMLLSSTRYHLQRGGGSCLQNGTQRGRGALIRNEAFTGRKALNLIITIPVVPIKYEIIYNTMIVLKSLFEPAS